MRRTGVFTFLWLLVAMAMFSPLSARDYDRGNDRQRIVLDYYGEHFRARDGATLFLKQKLKEQYPRMNVKRLKLKAAVLVAKTKHGYGKAYLTVGQNESYEETIGTGNAEFWDDYGYTRTRFRNPTQNSQGRWQIQLRGKFRVNKVVLIVKKGGGSPLYTETMGEIRFPKFMDKTKSMYIGKDFVKQLSIKANNAPVEVLEAYVVFDNGREKDLYALEGKVRRGSTKTATFEAPRGRNIQKLVITATSPRLDGSRGKLEVSVKSLRR